MALKQDSGKNKPLKKVRAGRFQISIWRFQKLLSNGNKDSIAYIEQWIDVERACIQYSTYNKATGQWENQSIWCPVDDLRNLAEVVDQLNEEDDSSFPEEESEAKRFSHQVRENPKGGNEDERTKAS